MSVLKPVIINYLHYKTVLYMLDAHAPRVSLIALLTVAAPLVKIKQAIQKLRQEISQMDIRIGVVDHILLQAKLKDKHDQNRSVQRAAQDVDEDVI